MSHLHVQPLFAGALARVTDVRCRAPAGACGPEERADGHALIFTRAGVFVRHDAATRGGRGRRVVVAEPVHALLMNRGEPYRVSHPAAGGDDCTSLRFDDAAALDVAAAVDARALDRPATPFRMTHAPLDAPALLRLRALRRALRTRRTEARDAVAGDAVAGDAVPGDAVRGDAVRGDALAVEEESLALLAEVVRAGHRAHGVAARPARAATARARRDLVERTKETLAARPGAPRALAALAGEVHASPFHLTRVFRDVVGVPVHQYLLRLRLAVALERLDGGERNLSALALDLGFSSHSHFTTAFRRCYGVVPSALGGRARPRAAGRGPGGGAGNG